MGPMPFKVNQVSCDWSTTESNRVKLLASSKARQDLLEARLDQAGPSADVEAVLLSAFAERPVFNVGTNQWVVMRPSRNELRLWVRR